MQSRVEEPVSELGHAAALPRIPVTDASALNRLYSGESDLDLSLADAHWRIEWLNVSEANPSAFQSHRFRAGAHVGHLGLDWPTLQTLLSERRLGQIPRDLRYILLADALHACVDLFEDHSRLHFEWQPAAGEAPTGADLQVDLHRAAFFLARCSERPAVLRGYIAFEDAAALDALVPADIPARANRSSDPFEALSVPLNFLLGTTPVQIGELRAIRPGDIIGIEQWNPSGNALSVTAEVGGPGGLQLAGVAEDSRITIRFLKDSAMNEAPSNSSTDSDQSIHLPLSRLDALEVTVRFEVGELTLSLRQLKSIRPGHVFDLGMPLNRSPVRILAHGNMLGKGYLVAVGDRLGVRVSEFAPGEV